MDIPIKRLMRVAIPETCRERKVILMTSGSKVTISQKAFLIPSRMSSIFYSKFKIRISKPETNSNFRNPNVLNVYLFGTFENWYKSHPTSLFQREEIAFPPLVSFSCRRQAKGD
jgi:hypothetical protein